MKHSLILAFGFLLWISPAHSQGAKSRLILLDTDSSSEVAKEVERRGGEVLRNSHSAKGLVVELPDASIEALQKRFSNQRILKDKSVKWIEAQNSKAGAKGKPQPTVPPLEAQVIPWGVAAIHAPQAHALGIKGAGVKVCIVDTGIDKDHKDLSVFYGENFVAKRVKGRFVLDSTAWDDDNGHGTHVSGSVAALDNAVGVVGVAPEASLIGAKVLDGSGSGYITDVADGVHACRLNGANVINMSLGASGDPNLDCTTSTSTMCLLKNAIQQATDAGIVVVVAAGNSGEDIGNEVPAGYSNVIAVSAVDGELKFPYWSNFGLSLKDFAAPGVSIESTWNNGSLETISGTSMAAPHVAGVAALAISKNSKGLMADDIGASVSRQGAGLINALTSALND